MTAASPPRRNWRRLISDQANTWLPILLMLFLTVGSWWLVQNASRSTESRSARPSIHVPDYTMEDFSMRNFSAVGALQSELWGEQAEHFPRLDRLQIQAPRMQTFDELGRQSQGRARQAISNSNGSRIELHGQAELTRAALQEEQGKYWPQLKMYSDFLLIENDDQRISSDQPTKFWRDRDHFESDRFEYDDNSGVAQLQGHVRGTLYPATTP